MRVYLDAVGLSLLLFSTQEILNTLCIKPME